MSTNILGVSIEQTGIPKEFIRGQTMEFIMELPPEVPANFFRGYVAAETPVETTLACQLRRLENASESGLIATLLVTWEDAAGTKLRFKSLADDDTNQWPLGPAELDVVFTRTVQTEASTGIPGSTTVNIYRSLPVRITIVDGVTT